MQGVGGGISVLYKHSHYEGESGDSVTLNTVMLFENKAVSGSACAFQSLPTHGKRLFKGVRLMDTGASFFTTKFEAMDMDELLEMFYLDVNRYPNGLGDQPSLGCYMAAIGTNHSPFSSDGHQYKFNLD